MISIIQKPVSFKIRRKSDIKTFKNVCLCNGSKYIIKINPNYIFMLEKMENNIIGTIKQGDLFNIFNPEIQINVDEWVWKLRKYINKKIFFVENIILSVEMKHSPIRFILSERKDKKVVLLCI